MPRHPSADQCVDGVQHAPLFDPGGLFPTRHHATNNVAFRSENDVGSTENLISRLFHAACWTPVYASHSGAPPNRATLGSGGWLILSRSRLSPAGLLQEVSILSVIPSSNIPLLQALPGALSARDVENRAFILRIESLDEPVDYTPIGY